MRIVDSHVHLTSSPIFGRGDVARLRREMRRAGIAKALLISDRQRRAPWWTTEKLLKATEAFPELKVIAGIDGEGAVIPQIRELKKVIASGRVVGLKLYPGYQYFYPAVRKLKPLYAFAAEHKLPVVIHSGDLYPEDLSRPPLLKYSHPLHVDEAAALNPKVTFVVAHVGNPWCLDCAEVMFKNPNVYADLSGFLLGKVTAADKPGVKLRLKMAFDYLDGCERFLFGTDWPLIDLGGYLKFMLEVVPRRFHKAVFQDNAAKVFGV
jgi:uncharacterized protein